MTLLRREYTLGRRAGLGTVGNLARLLRLRLDGANLSWNGTEHLVFVWWFSEHEVVQATVIESEKRCSAVMSVQGPTS